MKTKKNFKRERQKLLVQIDKFQFKKGRANKTIGPTRTLKRTHARMERIQTL